MRHEGRKRRLCGAQRWKGFECAGVSGEQLSQLVVRRDAARSRLSFGIGGFAGEGWRAIGWTIEMAGLFPSAGG
ncbi:hypothetical protein BRO54_0667 [Geobacillus proteiniphilus]|uniref:Uncharacterized protein n=1 Tax=Geobacillus proteiniphilus TaxID=860353 RepID=A0A1Q5T709_9BACL|nr:hypothetical protein [Geobacillus proteiniphilus]OKO96037.1 hypothetical protein BRO54_0667 [Geobacillus proteiniphilus]